MTARYNKMIFDIEENSKKRNDAIISTEMMTKEQYDELLMDASSDINKLIQLLLITQVQGSQSTHSGIDAFNNELEN